jgi:PEP-CTERM motif
VVANCDEQLIGIDVNFNSSAKLDLWGNQNLTPNGACDFLPINGLPSGFGCRPNTSPNTVGAVPAKLTFVFGVTEPVLNSSANIFALYAKTSNGAGVVAGGTIIGETPNTSIPIQNTNSGGGTGGSSGGGGGGGGTPVPEPGVLTLLSIGLVALAVFHRALMALPKVSTI